MAATNQHDYQRVLAFLDRLYAITGQEDLPAWLVREIPKLVACHHCSWNDFAVTVPRSTVVEFPKIDRFSERTAMFSEHFLEHPGITHYLATGDLEPYVISDHMEETGFHRTALYNELFVKMNYRDQLGVMLAPPAGRVSGFALARERRGFSERDREIVRLIRPHVRNAQRNIDALARAGRRASQFEPGGDVALLHLDEKGRILRGVRRARPILDRFFPDRIHKGTGGMPGDLASWLHRGARIAFRMQKGRHVLLARFFPATKASGLEGRVLIESRSSTTSMYALRAKGLTDREIEVLGQLERGLSNDEIAVALVISPLTVKKHLENLYSKLRVGNRTAAVFWMRRELASLNDEQFD